MLIVVNGKAKGQSGAARWARVREGLLRKGVRFAEVTPQSVEDAARAVADGIRSGHEVIVAAGGDGTMHATLNALMDPASDRPRDDVALGAIGLGSSNDFHKPFARERTIARFPVRIDRGEARRVDVGKARLLHPDGTESIRYFLLNASLGIVADANAFFNQGDAAMRLLKRGNTEVAILYAAFVNIAACRAARVRAEIEGALAFDESVINIGVLKSVHFAGGMRYDTPVARDDGTFVINVWNRSSRVRVVRTMLGLYGGKFRGRPATQSFYGQVVRLTPERPLHLELDGEVFPVTRAELSVLPRTLLVCG